MKPRFSADLSLAASAHLECARRRVAVWGPRLGRLNLFGRAAALRAVIRELAKIGVSVK
jgi:hypothetical protein